MSNYLLRSFIALTFSQHVKRYLWDIISSLAASDIQHVRWVNPAGLHLTLQFLGSVPKSLIQPMLEALQTASRKHPPFFLELSPVKGFPSALAPKIIGPGITGQVDRLLSLQRDIVSAALSLGHYPAHKNPGFQPHITLGRITKRASSAQRADISKKIARLDDPDTLALPICAIDLIHSTLTQNGPVYKKLGSVPLAGEDWIQGRMKTHFRGF